MYVIYGQLKSFYGQADSFDEEYKYVFFSESSNGAKKTNKYLRRGDCKQHNTGQYFRKREA